MGRAHGRRGRVYLGIASDSATAEPLPFIAKWAVNHQSDKVEVTAMGDSNKVYVGGLADATGTFSGSYDDATAQTYTAAIDGLARKFYLYPDLTTNTRYWFGTILVDASFDGGVDQAINMSASWNAASQVQRVG